MINVKVKCFDLKLHKYSLIVSAIIQNYIVSMIAMKFDMFITYLYKLFIYILNEYNIINKYNIIINIKLFVIKHVY